MKEITDPSAWRKLILSGNPTFFSSWEWGDVQKAAGRSVWRGESQGVPFHFYGYGLPGGKKYLYIQGGPPFLKEGFDWRRFKKEILGNPFSKGAIFVKIEPYNEITLPNTNGLKRSAPVQPDLVRVLDLRKRENDIWEGLEQATRYAIKTAEKRGVSVKKFSGADRAEAFEKFWELYTEMNKRKGMVFLPKSYYKKISTLEGDCHSKIFLSYVDGVVVNAALFVYFHNSAHYLFAASKDGYGRFNAPSLTLWRAIQEARAADFKEFNLGGISHVKRSQFGLTAFKKGFGGREVKYPGAWDLPLDGMWYLLYRFAKSVLKPHI